MSNVDFLYIRWYQAIRSLSEALNLDADKHQILVEWMMLHMFEVGQTYEVDTRYSDEAVSSKDIIKKFLLSNIVSKAFEKKLFSFEETSNGFYGTNRYIMRMLIFGAPQIVGPEENDYIKPETDDVNG